MIVERIQVLHEDYIRATERFKALWTFQQFLRGVYKTFLSGEPEITHDFPALYEEILHRRVRVVSTPTAVYTAASSALSPVA